MRYSSRALALIIFLVPFIAKAQGVDDALLYSQTLYEGTGRSIAMGNAVGAMGGDFTSACINPAGLGLYRSSELSLTSGLQHTFITSSYYGTQQHDGRMRLSIPNFDYVVSMECSNYKPLRFLQMGIGLTRTNDFSYRSDAQGLNPYSSMIDDYLQCTEGLPELFNLSQDPGNLLSNAYPYDLYPAWQTYLIDRFQDSLGAYFSSPIPQGNVNQRDQIVSRGRSEEWTFAASANIKEKLFVGASLGLSHIKRISKRTYRETPGDPLDPDNTFTQWEHQEELGDTAWGLNLKCGVISYPTRWLRVGVAWHSRNLFSIGETWATETSSQLIENHQEVSYKSYSPYLYHSYDFFSPHTFIGSLAFLFGRRGMITTDVEYMDYSTSKLYSSSFSFSDANASIKDILGPTLNFRVGTEWCIYRLFLRGGAAYYGSPYGFGENYGSVKKASLGLGYVTENDVYWDFAYELTESTTGYAPYTYYVDGANAVADVVQHKFRNKFLITFRMKM